MSDATGTLVLFGVAMLLINEGYTDDPDAAQYACWTLGITLFGLCVLKVCTFAS